MIKIGFAQEFITWLQNVALYKQKSKSLLNVGIFENLKAIQNAGVEF